MAKYFTKDGDDYVEVSESLLTQAEIESTFLPKRLEQYKRNNFGDYDDLKERVAKLPEIETKLADKDVLIGDLTGKLKTAELQTEKVKVLNEFKLSDELAEFVFGETPDEMRKRAEKLAKGVTGGKVIVTKDGKPEEKEGDTKKLVQGLFGKKSDD